MRAASFDFPVTHLRKTAEYYKALGFQVREEEDLSAIWLRRDELEIRLLPGRVPTVMPLRALYGCGYDGRVVAEDLAALEAEFAERGGLLAQSLAEGDGQSFVLEDPDGRRLLFQTEAEEEEEERREPGWYRTYSAGYLLVLLILLAASVFFPGARGVCLVACYGLLVLETAVQAALGKLPVLAAAAILLTAAACGWLRQL